MRPTYHVMISGGVSAVFALWAKSWGAVLACFFSGILIDLDHHLDYWMITKKIPWSYKKLVDFFVHRQHRKVYLFLHSYEMLTVLWLSIFYFDLNAVWIGMAVGFTTHILCDEFANPLKPLSYFFVYRLRNGFERKHFFKKGHD